MLSINHKYYSQALNSYFPKLQNFDKITKVILEFLKGSKDDFDRIVTKVYLSYCNESADEVINVDFTTLFPALGFQVSQMFDFGYLRDSIFFINDILICPNAEKSTEVLERLKKSRLSRFDHVAFNCSHDFFYNSHFGYGTDAIAEDCRNFQKIFCLKMQEAPFYFEGGNHFVVSHPKLNDRCLCLFGIEGFYFALIQLRLKKFFHNNPYQKKEDFETLKTRLKGQMSEAWIDQNVTEMRSFGFLVPAEYARDYVVEYQAQKETLKKVIGLVFRIWPESFVKQTPFNDLPDGDVVLIPQLTYHLDVFVHPGPNGSIFLQSFDLCLSWLLDIKKEALPLTEKEERCLKLLLEGALELSSTLKDFLQIIRRVLKGAGFSIIEFPGLFLSSTAQSFTTYHPEISFINGLSGYSEKTKRNFFIVAGTSVGSRVGQILMNRLQEFFKRYETDVFFVGRNPQDASDFSQVDPLWNKRRAGVHCLTTEE